MSDSLFPSFHNWFGHGNVRWRLSTWWPSDALESMQHSLLQILSVAHRERLDVTPLVANLAEEHRGRYRRRLRRLALRLADGTPLVDALEQTPDVLKDEDVLAIRFASQIGTLGPMYDSLLSDSADHDNRASTVRRQAFIYSFFTLCILVLAIFFLVTFILPTLKKITEEFGLPGSNPFFQTFLSVTDWFVRNARPRLARSRGNRLSPLVGSIAPFLPTLDRGTAASRRYHSSIGATDAVAIQCGASGPTDSGRHLNPRTLSLRPKRSPEITFCPQRNRARNGCLDKSRRCQLDIAAGIQCDRPCGQFGNSRLDVT